MLDIVMDRLLKQMIQRYYRFMQLKASYPPETLLIPTLDIEIVWQTHLLRPEMIVFVYFVVSLIIKNEIEKYFKEQAFSDTCQLYEQYSSSTPTRHKIKVLLSTCDYEYESGYHNEPINSYWDKTYFEFASNPSSDYENPFSFTEGDIIVDGKFLSFCKQFMCNTGNRVLYNGSNRISSDKIALKEGELKLLKKSYERFLYMAAKYPLKDGNGFIPPTYAIDLIWHSHMQEPLKYEADCLRLVGYVIYHDPWPVVEDKMMKKSCDQVDQIWKSEFQCEIETDHLHNTSDNRNRSLASDTTFFNVLY